MDQRYGALEAEWAHFNLVLGLREDLLPVVSNPSAVISAKSKLQFLGKTPSRYNRERQVAGIADWTSHEASDRDLAQWAAEADYGICLQTRRVRALDIDISDNPEMVRDIVEFVAAERHFGEPLPVRMRADSSKLLLAFTLPGEYAKRTIKTAGGIIEFLATGQQFVACGTHPGGARYEWRNGEHELQLPYEFPELTPEEFERVWSALEKQFAIEPSTKATTSTKSARLAAAAENDPVALALFEKGAVNGTEMDGRLHVACPFADEHERESDITATTYWPANTGGYALGHFKCLHAPCEGRSDRDFLAAFGLAPDPRDDFEAAPIADVNKAQASDQPVRFLPVRDIDFRAGPPPGWLIKRVLPRAELGVVYGASGAGKSFVVLDMVAAIARGMDSWCGRKVRKGQVVYIAAEGAAGFRNRLNAYCSAHGLDDIGLYVIAGAPNFMLAKDIIELVNAIRPLSPDLVVVDTLAQVTPGANENAGEDMGLALGHCGLIHTVTGSTVLLIHHSGKDAAKGARGWSGIKGALNVELEVSRFDTNRTLTVSKMRDGSGEGDQYGFTLREVPIGMDEDGDVVTSCVVEYGDVIAPASKGKKMGPNEEAVLRAALDLQTVDGSLPGVEIVISKAVEGIPFDAGTGKRDRRRETLGRALSNLIAAGRLSVTGGGVAVPQA